MMKKHDKALTVMGFARYRKRAEISTEQLIDACLNWRREFLDRQPGIAMHCFLGNTAGEYADAILATDRASFEAMASRHPDAESSRAFMALLEPDSVRLATNALLGDAVTIPNDFACIEFGTFQRSQSGDVSERQVIDAAREVETDYLSGFSAVRAHFMGRIDERTYSEITFVETLGEAREICRGYAEHPACASLLALIEPDSTDLDFWFVLA